MLYTINDSEEITNLVEGLVINDDNKTISKKRSRDSVFRNNVYNSYNTILTSLNIILRTNHFIKIIRNWRVNIPRDTWYRKFECGEVLFFY
jgi:hypothetical protein